MTKLSLLDDAPGFDEPLEMLDACHGRIKAQITTLHRLAAHLPVHGADVQARQAAAKVIRYFSTAGENHHADEEIDLFPALLAHAAQERDSVSALIERLLADHVRMGCARADILAVLTRIEQGEAAELSAQVVADFDALYSDHISRETDQLLPLAARLLPIEEIKKLSLAMASRRGVVI